MNDTRKGFLYSLKLKIREKRDHYRIMKYIIDCYKKYPVVGVLLNQVSRDKETRLKPYSFLSTFKYRFKNPESLLVKCDEETIHLTPYNQAKYQSIRLSFNEKKEPSVLLYYSDSFLQMVNPTLPYKVVTLTRFLTNVYLGRLLPNGCEIYTVGDYFNVGDYTLAMPFLDYNSGVNKTNKYTHLKSGLLEEYLKLVTVNSDNSISLYPDINLYSFIKEVTINERKE